MTDRSDPTDTNAEPDDSRGFPTRRDALVAGGTLGLAGLGGALFSGGVGRQDDPSSPDDTPGSPTRSTVTQPGDRLLDGADRDEITGFLNDHVERGTFPGAVVAIVDTEGPIYTNAVGQAQIVPETREMTVDTVFDLASMTKAVATTTVIMQLIERNELGLWDSLGDFYDLSGKKRDVTVRTLLTHTSGLPAWKPLWKEVDRPENAIDYILHETSLQADPGTEVTYSDLGFILLGDLVRQVAGTPLDEYAAANVFDPLGMDRTAYNPSENLPESVEYAATERSAYYDNEVVVGEVHDENAAFLGGVSGHAGLFSTIDDLSTFAIALLNGGTVDGTRILSNRTVKAMTRNWVPGLLSMRGLGWDLREMFGDPACESLYDRTAFGQNGFTGTSIWFDPCLGIGVVALTNRVHPTRENTKILDFRPAFHARVASLVSS